MTSEGYECSKKSVLNSVGWRITDIDSVTQVIGGGTPSTKNSKYWGGGIPWITPKDLSGYSYRYITHGERNITEDGLKNSSAKLIPKNSILLTTRAPIGYLAIAKIEVTTNQGIHSLVPNDNVSPLFLYYLLKNNIEYLKSNANGSTFGELSQSSLEQLHFAFPELDEQIKIAKILSDLDSKIELNQQMNKTLESIAQTLFKHWFIDFEFPNENGQPYKSGGGEMVDSELGEIPKNWRVSIFSQAIKVNPERKMSKGKFTKKISMSDLDPWQSWIKKWNYESYTSGSKFKNGDTLFARITPSLEHGKTAMVHLLDEDEIGYGSTEFIVFGRKEIKSDVYIFNLCRSDYIRTAAIGSMTGTSGRQRVPNYLFDQLLIVVPPEELINFYDRIVLQFFRRVFVNASEIHSLIQIKDSLLPKLLSGKISVPVGDTNE